MTASTVPRRLIEVAHEISDTGESVLYDETGRRLLVLNAVGAHVWSLMDGERSVSDLATILQTSFEGVEYAQLLKDIEAFVGALVTHGAASSRE